MIEHTAYAIRRKVKRHFEYVMPSGENGDGGWRWSKKFSEAAISFDGEWTDLRAQYAAKWDPSIKCITLTIMECL